MELFGEWMMRLPHGMGRDLERYAIFAIGVWFVLWVALARLLMHRKIRDRWPERRQMVFEFLYSLRSIAIFSLLTSAVWLMWRTGVLPWAELNARLEGPVWFWGTVIAMVLAHDAYFYWVHRWMHSPKRFRLYHRRHHVSNNPSPFTAYSFDLREAGMMVLFVMSWEILIPNPQGSVTMFVLVQLAKNTLAHSGFELMPATREGKPLLDWMTTTVHHDLHHRRAGYNFGLYFTWWDRWCGTEDPIYHDEFKRVVRQREDMKAAAPAPV
jgi:sterol desaturase/sphingolipid hydroxylase (fatty acid hydroxylase superfamily)